VRSAIPLLAALATIALVGCGGKDKAAEPVPPAQRYVTAAEAPGSKPDPDETRHTAGSVDEFIATYEAIDPDNSEMTEVLGDAGFKRAGIDTRFYGETHTPGKSTHVVSSFVELESEDGASDALEWLATDTSKPCPRTCATRITTFDVDGLGDGARGVHRIATGEDIKAGGNADEIPSDSYWVGFTSGAIVYTVDLFGRPGAVSKERALEIAHAYYDRVTGGD
jgi:hypothetical protein